MKIALVSDWYHPRVGGIELHLQDLAKRLVLAAHDVVVITPTPGDAVVDGIRVRRIAAPLAPLFGFLTTAAGVRAVGDVLADEHVDVAHCHVSIVSPAALGGAYQAQRRNIPTVLTFHSVVPQTHLLARAAARVLNTPAWRARFSAVSARVAREVQAIAPNQPITVVPNGIDVGFWRTTPAARSSDTLRLVSVMRLNPKKRPLALVEIMLRLSSLLPRRVSLRIVGDGPERNALANAITRADLSGRIELLGRRSRVEIRDIFSESDVFVLPTVRESFGLAALEARCAGLPVIAMKASGVAEFIRHGREGLLAQSDEEIAAHAATLALDVERRDAISRYNRETTPPYDWPSVIEQNVALYREAIVPGESVRTDM